MRSTERRRKGSLHRLPWSFVGLVFTMLICPVETLSAGDPVFKSKDHAYKAVTLADGLDKPWGMAFLPKGGGILITEKTGKVRLYKDGLRKSAISGGPKSVELGQGGLLDIALHPDFLRNRWVYFTYVGSDLSGVGMELARARYNGSSFENLNVLFKAQPKTGSSRHFGSRLAFDRTNHLFVTHGDRGSRQDAQRLSVDQGSVFRFTADGRVPKDNPFVSRADARPEIFSYGHRNVQGAALHPQTGILWVHEHGPQGGDEVNIIRPGGNYGWPVITYGEEYGGGRIAEHTEMEGLEQPILYWVPSIAPSGMAFYTGDRFPRWTGNLFVGALRGRQLRRVILQGDKVLGQEELLTNLDERIRDVENGPDGYLYVLTDSGDGRLIRLEPLGN